MKKITFIGLLLICALATYAQESYFFLNWNYQVPLSNRVWLDNSTGSAATLGYRFFLNEKPISIGLDVHWATFEQYEPMQYFQTGNSTLSTDYYKYIYQYGAVISSQYNFPLGEKKLFIPYVGLGLGANYNNYTLYYNVYSEDERKVGFLARPEAGILARFGYRRTLGAMAAVHFDYSTNKSQNYNYKNFTSAGFRLGIVLMAN